MKIRIAFSPANFGLGSNVYTVGLWEARVSEALAFDHGGGAGGLCVVEAGGSSARKLLGAFPWQISCGHAYGFVRFETGSGMITQRKRRAK